MRLQYSFEDVQEKLRKELEVHTQGSSQEISTYLLKVRDLLDQLKTPLTLGEQLDLVYQKLHPSYRLRIERKDFENFPELQRLGKREQLRRAQEYKPPLPISDSFSCFSLYPSETAAHVRLAPVVQTSLDEVEVTLSSSSNLAPVATTQAEERSQQRSSRDRKFKPPDGQQREKKDRKRKSKSCGAGQKKECRAKSTENQPTLEPPKIEVVPPSGKFEDMQRRKMGEHVLVAGRSVTGDASV